MAWACLNEHDVTNPRLVGRLRLRCGTSALLVSLLVAATVLPGCVRRTLQITTHPPQALVFLNDQEIGRSEVSTDFVWYGDYDIVVRKKGYQTLKTHWRVKAPWYQWVPIDFFFDVLWAGTLHDVHTRHFELEPIDPPTHAELLDRATQTRQDALLAPG